jgi:hypothetical protein
MKKIHTFVVLAYKESPHLESCIKSVLNQSLKTNVVIATSTPNAFITSLAEKYKLEVKVNSDKQKGIGYDFDFAVNCVDTELVTVSHQDDIYDYDYAKEVVKHYKKWYNCMIIITDYYEIKNGKKVSTNVNLKIKRVLLFPLRLKIFSGAKIFKRAVLSFGCPICCPSVTFVKKMVPKKIFASDFKCNIDWVAWERLSKRKGKFIFISKKLMGHRIHEESTTSEILRDNIRTKEDLEMFKRFWPKSIAKFINKFYIKSEQSNKLK